MTKDTDRKFGVANSLHNIPPGVCRLVSKARGLPLLNQTLQPFAPHFNTTTARQVKKITFYFLEEVLWEFLIYLITWKLPYLSKAVFIRWFTQVERYQCHLRWSRHIWRHSSPLISFCCPAGFWWIQHHTYGCFHSRSSHSYKQIPWNLSSIIPLAIQIQRGVAFECAIDLFSVESFSTYVLR